MQRSQPLGEGAAKGTVRKLVFSNPVTMFSAVPIPEINLFTVWNKPFRVYSLVCHGWGAKVDNGEQMGKPQHYYASGWNRLTGFRQLVIWF